MGLIQSDALADGYVSSMHRLIPEHCAVCYCARYTTTGINMHIQMHAKRWVADFAVFDILNKLFVKHVRKYFYISTRNLEV